MAINILNFFFVRLLHFINASIHIFPIPVFSTRLGLAITDHVLVNKVVNKHIRSKRKKLKSTKPQKKKINTQSLSPAIVSEGEEDTYEVIHAIIFTAFSQLITNSREHRDDNIFFCIRFRAARVQKK